MIRIFYFVSIIMILVSCKQPSQGFDVKNIVKPEDLGVFHKLNNDNISIYLPEGFKELTETETKSFIQKIKNKKIRYYFEKNLEAQKFVKGHFYHFYSEEDASEVAVRTIPFTPFGKRDAGQLLYMLRKNFEKYQKVTGIYHNKIKAVYSGAKSLQYFKVIYRLTRYNSYDEHSNNEDYEMFKTVYLITVHRKTFMITILTPFDINFDPYIRKIRI